MRDHKVAIQGVQSSFHDLAARKFYGEQIQIVPCRTFKEVCEMLISNRADYAVMAIENALAGSLLSNYNLINNFGLHIIGEEYLAVELHLMIHPNSFEKSIHTVLSHPIALAQCQGFLDQHPNWEPVEAGDTAYCARKVAESANSGFACIANAEAAAAYKLKIIYKNVEDQRSNYTRFIILSKTPYSVENADKASVSFQLKHKVGSLADVLTILKKKNVNLSKIQSVPQTNNPGAYNFHADLEWEDREDYLSAFKKVRAITKDLRILGEYKAAGMPFFITKQQSHTIAL